MSGRITHSSNPWKVSSASSTGWSCRTMRERSGSAVLGSTELHGSRLVPSKTTVDRRSGPSPLATVRGSMCKTLAPAAKRGSAESRPARRPHACEYVLEPGRLTGLLVWTSLVDAGISHAEEPEVGAGTVTPLPCRRSGGPPGRRSWRRPGPPHIAIFVSLAGRRAVVDAASNQLLDPGCLEAAVANPGGDDPRAP
jgi:hypothetical protein